GPSWSSPSAHEAAFLVGEGVNLTPSFRDLLKHRRGVFLPLLRELLDLHDRLFECFDHSRDVITLACSIKAGGANYLLSTILKVGSRGGHQSEEIKKRRPERGRAGVDAARYLFGRGNEAHDFGVVLHLLHDGRQLLLRQHGFGNADPVEPAALRT